MKVSVLGDLILDKYISGNVDRISPEAPVPIVDPDLEIEIISAVGDDQDGSVILSDLEGLGVNTSKIHIDNKISTSKTRIIGSKQIVRIDKQDKTYRDFPIEIPDSDILIISDYDIGVVGDNYFEKQGEITRNVKTIVDPKIRNFWKYRNVYCLKPNRKELWNALCCIWTKDTLNRNEIDEDIDISYLINEYREFSRRKYGDTNEYLLVTEGHEGMTLSFGPTCRKILTTENKVCDVTGAGDTVAAVFSYCIASGYSVSESSEYANKAAGISITQDGCGVVTSKELFG